MSKRHAQGQHDRLTCLVPRAECSAGGRFGVPGKAERQHGAGHLVAQQPDGRPDLAPPFRARALGDTGNRQRVDHRGEIGQQWRRGFRGTGESSDQTGGPDAGQPAGQFGPLGDHGLHRAESVPPRAFQRGLRGRPFHDGVLGGGDLAWLVARVRRRMERGEPLDTTVTLANASPEQRAAVQRLLVPLEAQACVEFGLSLGDGRHKFRITNDGDGIVERFQVLGKHHEAIRNRRERPRSCPHLWQLPQVACHR